jgi:glucokinase
MTNNSWVIRTSALNEQLGVERFVVLNDFGAVAHAVASLPADQFVAVCGPDKPLPTSSALSVIGAGTGLGVAHLHRFGGDYHVQSTEGGHIDFAPVDDVDDAILARLRRKYSRVSAERVVSGPGIVDIHAALAAREGRAVADLEDSVIWRRGLAGEDAVCAAAVERFCMSLGSLAGDYALSHGAGGVVIAGGLGLRLRNVLPGSGFSERFCFKGRYRQMMASLPVKLIIHPQPGLYGAVAAFAREYLERRSPVQLATPCLLGHS